MAIISGTTGTDRLIGTAGDDTLTPLGTNVAGDREVLRGLDGADTYDLRRNGPGGVYNFLIDDRGTDGAADAITNAGALYHSASLGYQAWATAVHVGSDLIIHLPSRPYRFHKPGAPSYDIKIKDQYGDGHVETMQAGGVTYNLAAGPVGSALADIMAGTKQGDDLSADTGDDWMFGNGGNDTLDAGDGDDIVFGGRGRDAIDTGAGNDRVFGDDGRDTVHLGAGNDQAQGGTGNDRIRGDGGNDWIRGEDGGDLIRGGAGQDMIDGGAGNDRMFGGRDGDLYSFAADAGGPGWGHDLIREATDAPSYQNVDKLSFAGFYGPSDGGTGDAYARLSFVRDGTDMVVSADGGASTVRVQGMFGGAGKPRYVEQVEFGAGYWAKPLFQILSAGQHRIGDDRNPANSDYAGAANEILFGSDGDDMIYGDSGTNFIWTGAGADTLVYKENDAQVWYSPDMAYVLGGGGSHDIVEDFDVAVDRMDFTEIASVTSLADLTVSADADGDALIGWNSGTWEVANILIELRGVSVAEVTADLFVFV